MNDDELKALADEYAPLVLSSDSKAGGQLVLLSALTQVRDKTASRNAGQAVAQQLNAIQLRTGLPRDVLLGERVMPIFLTVETVARIRGAIGGLGRVLDSLAAFPQMGPALDEPAGFGYVNPKTQQVVTLTFIGAFEPPAVLPDAQGQVWQSVRSLSLDPVDVAEAKP